MKASIQNQLLQAALGRINKSIIKGKDPAEVGQYLSLVVNEKAFTAIVARRDVVSKIVLDIPKLGSMASTDGKWNCVFDGDMVSKFLSYARGQDMIHWKYQDVSPEEGQSAPTPQDSDEDSEEKSDLLLAETGRITIEAPGFKGKTSRMTTSCFRIPVDAKVEAKPDSETVIKGQDLVSVIKLLKTSVGEKTMSDAYNNVLFRVKEGVVTLASTNMVQLALSNLTPVSSKLDFACTLPFDVLALVVGMLDPNADVSVFMGADSRTMIIAQDIVFGSNNAGKAVYKCLLSTERFPNVEKRIEPIQFKTTCRVRTEEATDAIRCVDAPSDVVRTRFEISATASEAGLLKVDGKQEIAASFALYDCKNDTNTDPTHVILSSEHLAQVLSVAGEEFTLKFSGHNSMACAEISPTSKMYFMTFPASA